MNKSQLTDLVAEQTGMSKKAAALAVDATLNTITKAVAAGETVNLSGFGAFSVTRRKARTGRHPRTGDPINIASTALPKFTAGSRFKTVVNDPS